MANETPGLTVEQALHPTRVEKLPSGRKVTIKQLLLDEWAEMLLHYSRLLEVLVILHDEDPSEQLVHDEMPTILMDMHAQGGAEAVGAFLGFFWEIPEERKAAPLAGFTPGEVVALWELVWTDNRRPFGLRLRQLARSGEIPTVREKGRSLLEQTLAGMRASSSPSTEPESTPGSEDSPSTTRSPSRKRSSSGKSGTASSAGT